MAPPKRLVLGLGNPLAGSDAFGPAVVAQLRARGVAPDGTTLGDAGTDLLGQIESFRAYDDVVLVDAIVGLPQAGEVAVFDEVTFSAWPETPASVHHMAPVSAVKLFRALYPDSTTRIRLVGYATREIALGAPLPQDAVEAGMAAVAGLLAGSSSTVNPHT